MRVAHRTPDSERISCPVGASCGEAGSEVGSIDGLADAGRCRRLCAVRGGLCARCCAVLSTCVAMSRCGAVGDSGCEAAACTRPPRPPCGPPGAVLLLVTPPLSGLKGPKRA